MTIESLTLFYIKVVTQRIGIHFQDSITHKGVFFLCNILSINAMHLFVNVLQHVVSLRFRVFVRKAIFAIEEVERDVIYGEETVSGMDSVVYKRAYMLYEVRIADVLRQSLQCWRNTLSYSEMHLTFIALYTRFHAEKVVTFALFEVRVTAAIKKFASLEVVIRVILVSDRRRHEVCFLDVLSQRASACKSEHLYEALLCAVV